MIFMLDLLSYNMYIKSVSIAPNNLPQSYNT